jgi:hypothetical protein
MNAPTDWNDMAGLEGLDEVARQIEDAQPTVVQPEWPDPILPGTMRTPAITAEVLPSWLGKMAHGVSEATQTPPALAVMCSLSILAMVLQGRFEVEPHPGYTEPLAIWTLSTAPPGARKTQVLGSLQAPILRWEKLLGDRFRSKIAKVNAMRAVAKKRIERLLQDAAKAKASSERISIQEEIEREETEMPLEIFAPRLFTSEITGEHAQTLLVRHDGRMAVLSDEAVILQIMGGMYNSGSSANNGVFLQGHAGSAMRVDRAGRFAHIDKPALSFGLLIQPATLADLASSAHFRDTGLLARFLWAMPISNVGKRDVRKHTPVPASVSEEYERRLFQLLEGVPAPSTAPKVLPLAVAAREAWLDMAAAIELEQGDGGRYESISDWTSKLPGAVARIAALLELAQAGLLADQVSLDSMARAIQLAQLLIPHAQAAFGLLGTDAVDTDALSILRWIRAGELAEFTKREAQKAQEGRFRNVERLQKALDRLVQQDVLRSFKRHNKGAPASVVFRVNPKVLST